MCVRACACACDGGAHSNLSGTPWAEAVAHPVSSGSRLFPHTMRACVRRNIVFFVILTVKSARRWYLHAVLCCALDDFFLFSDDCWQVRWIASASRVDRAGLRGAVSARVTATMEHC
jgi:hypothetical protein